MQQLAKQKGFNFEWISNPEKLTSMNDGFYAMREWQKRAFDLLKDSPAMILNAPMGSGKSWLMCLLSAYKMKADSAVRCIITVPQTIIAPGFVDAKVQMPDGEKIYWKIRDNLCEESAKNTVNSAIEWLEDPRGNRVLLCTHATLVAVYKKLKEQGRLTLLNNSLFWIDEAHHVKNCHIEDFDAVISNGLGELVVYLLNSAENNVQLGLTTASFFRGDRGSLLTSEMESKFLRFNLPYDEYFQSMTHLKSFNFDFLISGHDYANAIAHVVQSRKGKDIIYIPHPVSRCSTGDKIKEAENIVAKYNNIHGGSIIHTAEGLIVLRRADKKFIILDLVNENRRAQKKNFLNNSVLRNDRDSLDAILALGMFKEGANWIWADRSIIVGARSSLVDVIQMIGRLFRDADGKSHVEVIQLLPFSLDQQDEEKFRENLNNYLKAIFASLILENIFNPVKIKMPKEKRKEESDGNAKKEIKNWLSALVPDDAKQFALLEDATRQLIEIQTTNEQAAKDVFVLRDEYQKIIPRVLEQHGINGHKEEVSQQIWNMLARRTLIMQGMSVENIDFDILQRTNPLGLMLRYTSGPCGIDTFQKLRDATATSRGPWRPLEEARQFVSKLGLKSETEWQLYISKKMPNLPVLPHDIPRAPWAAYKDSGWISMGDFFGTSQIAPRLRKYKSYEDASLHVQSLGLRKKEDWFLYIKGQIPGLPPLPADIPACPDKTYRREEYGKKWVGWADFLGTGRVSNQAKSKLYRSYTEAEKYARSLGLKTAKDWLRYINGDFEHLSPLPLDIPRKPDEAYNEWIDWPTFLGSPLNKFNSRRSFWDFETARKFVHSLKLKSQREFIDYCAGKLSHLPPKPLELPSNPSKKYKNSGWQGEKYWLGY